MKLYRSLFVRFAAYLHELLVQTPTPLRHLPHRLRSPFMDLTGEVVSKPIDPEADAFMAFINATLVESVFDISQSQRKSDVHQHGKLDDLG